MNAFKINATAVLSLIITFDVVVKGLALESCTAHLKKFCILFFWCNPKAMTTVFHILFRL